MKGPTETTKKIVIAKSGNLCSFPGCKQELTQGSGDGNNNLIANFAHIRGLNPGSARYDKNLSEKEVNSEDNLVVLCPNHHKEIDDDEFHYTVQKVEKIKKDHEKWANDQIVGKVMEITFSELDNIAKYIAENPDWNMNTDASKPDYKIKKNDFGSRVKAMIIRGLSQENLVDRYLKKHPDPEFGERLKRGFISLYEKLKSEDSLEGDDLFYSLFDKACERKSDINEKAAVLTVLSYYFEKCDIFEK